MRSKTSVVIALIMGVVTVWAIACSSEPASEEGPESLPSGEPALGQTPPEPFEPGDVGKVTEGESRDIAEDFVRNSATFAFDGAPGSLRLTETLLLRCPSCWEFRFSFKSRHAGYGDRKGQILAQVITSHIASVVVENGEVTTASMDGKWDMLTQEPMG